MPPTYPEGSTTPPEATPDAERGTVSGNEARDSASEGNDSESDIFIRNIPDVGFSSRLHLGSALIIALRIRNLMRWTLMQTTHSR